MLHSEMLQSMLHLGLSVYFCIITVESAIKQYITIMVDIDQSNLNGLSRDGFLVSSAMVAVLSNLP